ncbi:hypothetical protein H4R21_001473, partial [Coemansia helicoidea]
MDAADRRAPGAGIDVGADFDALLADHVRDAELVTGGDARSVSRQMLAQAAAAVSEGPGRQVVLIECNPRAELLAEIGHSLPASARGLDRLAIKYLSSAAMLRALLAAWHCGAGAGAGVGAPGALTESDFLVWSASGSSECAGDMRLPDCLFIDGIDAIASAE